MPDFSKQLSKYIPEAAAPIISDWINNTKCIFKITRSRTSKLGDYRAPYKGRSHQITVNHDLNPYSFLITTVHEFAHLKTFQEYSNQVKPHGVEWKDNFKELIMPFLKLEIFPQDITSALVKYMHNPAASSCTDISLYKVLKKYDKNQERKTYIDELPAHSIFLYQGRRKFKLLEKVRTRYKCIELDSNNIFLFSAAAEVTLLENDIKN